MFGAKRDEITGEWKKLHNAELYALDFSPISVQVRKKYGNYVTLT